MAQSTVLNLHTPSLQESLPFCTSRSIPVHKTDYTHDSLLDIFNTTQACTVISFINSASSEEYLGAHTALLSACQESTACKRLIPSEWIGDIDTWPLKPAFYAKTREPFRRMLRGQSREEEKKVEWTCVAVGWLMDYFLEERREEVYIPKVGVEEFPVDVQGWRAITRETGDERQSWTWGRDVGRGVVELLRAEKDSWVSGKIRYKFLAWMIIHCNPPLLYCSTVAFKLLRSFLTFHNLPCSSKLSAHGISLLLRRKRSVWLENCQRSTLPSTR